MTGERRHRRGLSATLEAPGEVLNLLQVPNLLVPVLQVLSVLLPHKGITQVVCSPIQHGMADTEARIGTRKLLQRCFAATM